MGLISRVSSRTYRYKNAKELTIVQTTRGESTHIGLPSLIHSLIHSLSLSPLHRQRGYIFPYPPATSIQSISRVKERKKHKKQHTTPKRKIQHREEETVRDSFACRK